LGELTVLVEARNGSFLVMLIHVIKTHVVSDSWNLVDVSQYLLEVASALLLGD
jgi:hypothetical protein